MKIAVCTYAYNAESTLPRAIDSILGQSFRDFEYYILDNGSTDQTWKVIKDYAARDERVFPMTIKENNIHHGVLLFTALMYASDADYIFVLDADDAYSYDYLEKVVPFARDNALDIVSCGYDMIDGKTGKLLKHRALTESIILFEDAFEQRFIEYRGFTLTLWGKLISIPFLRRLCRKSGMEQKPFMLYDDSNFVLSLFQKAERAGIYGEALYQYYQYPKSLSRVNLMDNILGHAHHVAFLREYLASYGPISKVNEDFLYAVYLSLVDESTERIFATDLPAEKKLDLLRQAFSEPLWAETLAREADPQFRNLANRTEYVAQMRERILALPATPEERTLAGTAVHALEGGAGS